MKWLEKNWVIVVIVIGAYMWLNGTLGNLLSGVTSPTAPAATTTGGAVTIMGG